MEINPDLEYTLTAVEKRKYESGAFKDKAKFKSAEEERDWARTQKRSCTKCKEILPLSYFNGNTSGQDPFYKDGYRNRRPECKSCTKIANTGKSKARQTAKKLGMTHKAPTGTKCELCDATEKIVFDHDHDTLVFRGWLCDPCNRSLGVLGDKVEYLIKAVNYLKKHAKKELYIDSETGDVKLV